MSLLVNPVSQSKLFPPAPPAAVETAGSIAYNAAETAGSVACSSGAPSTSSGATFNAVA